MLAALLYLWLYQSQINRELRLTEDKLNTTEIYLNQRIDALNNKSHVQYTKSGKVNLQPLFNRINIVNIEQKRMKTSIERVKLTEVYLNQRVDVLYNRP